MTANGEGRGKVHERYGKERVGGKEHKEKREVVYKAYLTSPAPDKLCPLGKQRLVGTELELVGGLGQEPVIQKEWWGWGVVEGEGKEGLPV